MVTYNQTEGEIGNRLVNILSHKLQQAIHNHNVTSQLVFKLVSGSHTLGVPPELIIFDDFGPRHILFENPMTEKTPEITTALFKLLPKIEKWYELRFSEGDYVIDPFTGKEYVLMEVKK